MDLAETLNRTMKLALDQGKARSVEDAQVMFEGFRLRIVVGPGFSKSPGLEAAVLTLLNAAPRTFLGGVEVQGALDELCTLGWFKGQSLEAVATTYGLHTRASRHPVPTIVAGKGSLPSTAFAIGLQCNRSGFRLSPDQTSESACDAAVEAGVAAAGAALNEAFHHAYTGSALAGQREIRFTLPAATLGHACRSAWVIGLGHLGQAALWTMALSHRVGNRLDLRLQDHDVVSMSSLSTCLLVSHCDVGRAKVNVLAERLGLLGICCIPEGTRLDLHHGPAMAKEEVALVAVDNVRLRRALDLLHGARIVEAGIGGGADAFTRVQTHLLPGPRRARDIWADGDPRASQAVDISKPAYQSLLARDKDVCGTSLLAGRAVATPFVGAFAGALVAWLADHPSTSQFEWNFDLNSLC